MADPLVRVSQIKSNLYLSREEVQWLPEYTKAHMEQIRQTWLGLAKYEGPARKLKLKCKKLSKFRVPRK